MEKEVCSKKLKQSNLKLKAKSTWSLHLGQSPRMTFTSERCEFAMVSFFFPRSNAKIAKILSVYRGGEDDSLNADEN